MNTVRQTLPATLAIIADLSKRFRFDATYGNMETAEPEFTCTFLSVTNDDMVTHDFEMTDRKINKKCRIVLETAMVDDNPVYTLYTYDGRVRDFSHQYIDKSAWKMILDLITEVDTNVSMMWICR